MEEEHTMNTSHINDEERAIVTYPKEDRTDEKDQNDQVVMIKLKEECEEIIETNVPSPQRDGSTSACSSEEYRGNLLNSAVTMHMTNCDNAYSPTLAICDIFSKEMDSSCDNETSTPHLEDEDSEFLIIDLDTRKMEKATKKQNKNCNSSGKMSPHHFRKSLGNSPTKGLILVNLSSQDEDKSGSHNNIHEISSDMPIESNFLQEVAKDCDISYDQPHRHQTGTTTMNCEMCTIGNNAEYDKDGKVTHRKTADTLEQMEFFMPEKPGVKNEHLESKNLFFQEMDMSNDANLSNDIDSSDVHFNTTDLNLSLPSNDNNDYEPTFYMPELYAKFYDEDKSTDQSICTFTKMSTSSSSLETDGSHPFEYPNNNDSANFDNSLNITTNQLDHSFYDHQAAHILPNYSFDEKNNKTVPKKEPSPSPYGILSCQYEELHTKINATPASCKLSYSSVPEHPQTNPLFPSSHVSNYCTSYPYNMQQPAPDANQTHTLSGSNYSDWSLWSGPAFSEGNLNSFAQIRTTDPQYQAKDEWPQDTSMMSELYHGAQTQLSMKSSQTDIDSEATEDADETDDVTIFLDGAACENLSNMSVMSSSGYSDSSSVMTQMSPSDFTPPPSASNTPISFSQTEGNVMEDYRFPGPFVNENTRSDPIHLYSPTMLAVAPYKLMNEKMDHTLIKYNQSQGTKRRYPSMADVHNSRTGFSISSTSPQFDEDEAFSFPDQRRPQKNQIQSDKISTSTSQGPYTKRKWTPNPVKESDQSLESLNEYIRKQEREYNELRKLRHNEPLKQTAIKIMSQWYEMHLDNPYPSKEDKVRMARDGGITVTQVKSWFANKRNRTNNTKPKVQKRAMKEKLNKLFQDLKHSRSDSMDNAQIIKQLSGIIQT